MNNILYDTFLLLITKKSLQNVQKYKAIIDQYNQLHELEQDFPTDVQEERILLNNRISEYIEDIIIVKKTTEFLMEIKCGTGGLDAQDWTQIIYNMYTKYFHKQRISYEILYIQEESSGGIRGALIKVNGIMENFMCEQGVHRLVRISPYNAQNKRQTSFCSIQLIPYISEQMGKIIIDKKDIKIDTYRASGAGGQHVNKTESAVRITHLPTNIVVQCQNEKSQLHNRDTAMNILLSKLEQKKQQELQPDRQVLFNTWSNHFRSYVFDPYKLIKDHNLDQEINNTVTIQSFLSGQVNPFIGYYNEHKLSILLKKILNN